MCSGWAITTHQWVSCRGAGTQSAALASWKVLNRHLSPQLEQQMWHPSSPGQGVCVLGQQRAQDTTCYISALTTGLLCRDFPALTLLPSGWESVKGQQEGGQGPHSVSWVQKGTVSSPCAPERPWGSQELLEFPGKLKSVQSSPQLSELGQGWGEACWAISEQGLTAAV